MIFLDCQKISQHQGENILFHLNVLNGEKKVKDYTAIVKEVQYAPVNDSILHIDFYRINLTKEIEVKVKVVTKGDAIGVKADGGALEHILWELDVICLPTKIPNKIEIDVTSLKIGDAIHVRDIVGRHVHLLTERHLLRQADIGNVFHV